MYMCIQERGKTRAMTPERLARNILMHHWDGLLPVDVKAIAEKLGIEVEPGDAEMDISGEVCSEQENGGYVIRYNPRDHEVRRRFTIAHEIGHVVLGHLSDRDRCLRDPREHYTIDNFDPVERDANRFAAALLMPADAVRAAVLRMEKPTISNLAEVFKVSKLAMEIRLKSLGIIPAWA